MAIKSTGLVACWGAGTIAGGVNPDQGQSIVPRTLGTCTQIAGGGYHSLAINSAGSVIAWGSNVYGQSTVPANLGPCIGISGGDTHTAVLRSNGTVVCFGGGSTNNGVFPEWGQSIVPAGLGTFTAVVAGGYHTIALKADGSVVAWGSGTTNAYSSPNYRQCVIPTEQTQPNSTAAIAAGGFHSIAISKVRQVPSQYPTIQAAIDASAPLDTVSVAAGTYAGPIAFNGKNIVVRGAGAATTIISGTGGVTSSVVRLMNAEPATARLEGFTIRNGQTGSPVPGNTSALAGGGIFLFQSSATVANCIVELNGASFGAGIYALYCGGVIENCTIRNNSGDAYGGGALLFDCTTIVRNCLISGNSTVTSGGGMHLVQIATSNFSPQVIGCTISGNTTVDRGGGIGWQAGTTPLQLVNCSVTGNSAPLAGGGVYSYPTGGVNRLQLVNTSVCNNTVRPNIFGLYTRDSSSTVCDCPGDIDGNGLVAAADLAILLSVWGTNASDFPAADTNHDGQVNAADLSLLLSSWGICAP